MPGNEPDLFYCYRHKKEPTRVTCGRCGRPLCPKCIVIGTAGVRCQLCAKGNVKVRPLGLAHDASSGISRLIGSVSRTTGGYWIVWIVIMLITSGALCGRHR